MSIQVSLSQSRRQQRSFVREVFEQMELRGAQLATITPQPQYPAFFVLDRQERFGGEIGTMVVVWLPGQVSGQQDHTLVLHPSTGEPLAVPALVVPAEGRA